MLFHAVAVVEDDGKDDREANTLTSGSILQFAPPFTERI